jgi:dimethylglycine dehydrogenase
MSLRIEKGYGSWGRDYGLEYWPQECGLSRLVKLEKKFLNREAYLTIAEKPAREVMSFLAIDAEHADATGGEPIFTAEGAPLGQVTSGAYGYAVGKSLAIAYLKAGLAKPGDEVSVAILGQPHRAVILEAPAFDPEGTRLRA